jgi:hypothetical protein
MRYAINQLKEERKNLEKCLSEWDLKKYADARIERQVRLESLMQAIQCLEIVSNGFNPLESGGFEHLKIKK